MSFYRAWILGLKYSKTDFVRFWQTFSFIFIDYSEFEGYILINNSQPCCITGSSFHENCECEGDNAAKITRCREICTKSEKCKGYWIEKDAYGTSCNLATTSVCPQGCYKYSSGNEGSILTNTTCVFATSYSGCYKKL